MIFSILYSHIMLLSYLYLSAFRQIQIGVPFSPHPIADPYRGLITPGCEAQRFVIPLTDLQNLSTLLS